MPIIGSIVNGVSVKFAPAVNRDVDARLAAGLRRVIKTDIATGHVLREIYITSAPASQTPSKQDGADGDKAIAISRINGMTMSAAYLSDKTVKAIVDAIQTAFETYPYRRENLGPYFQKKLGMPTQGVRHRDHIRLSVS